MTLLLILLILYSMFGSLKWVGADFAESGDCAHRRIVGAVVTGTHFSVSSGVGFLALFGVSVKWA